MKMRVSPLRAKNIPPAPAAGLEHADRCGPHRPQIFPPARRTSLRSRRIRRKSVTLLVHHVLGWIFDFDGFESSGSDMEDDIGAFDPADFEIRQ